MTKERLGLLVALILTAAFARLLPHPANVTPVAAIALFSGAMLPRGVTAFAVPLLAMLLSDLMLGLHSTMLFVYLGIMATVALGMRLHAQSGLLSVAGASLASSVFFFVVTNLGVWLSGGLYPLTAAGLAACFVVAIPFFTHSVLGDLFSAALLFGTVHYAARCFPRFA